MQKNYLIKVHENSQVGEARRVASTFASRLELDESDTGRVALIVTELGTNLVKHTDGKGGELLIQSFLAEDLSKGVEILALDQGPGITNLSESMQDGFSTTGTFGNGLGGIKRLSNHMEIFSRPNQGTAILSRISRKIVSSPKPISVQIGGICIPVKGESLSGDSWAHRILNSSHYFLAVDGLGHGLLAHEASNEAVRVFSDLSDLELENLFLHMHAALKKTRGAAISSLKLNVMERKIDYMGVGNISAIISTPQKHTQLVSLNGTVGHSIRKLQEFHYQLEKNSVVVLHSDGLGSKWNLNDYSGLANKHPTLIAGVLYRDYNRPKDDVSVIVAKVSEN